MPLVVGSLGPKPKQFGNRLKQIGIKAGTKRTGSEDSFTWKSQSIEKGS